MKKFHIAIAVKDINESIADYSKRIGSVPEIVVPEQYALWRTDIVNFSIRKITTEETEIVRHIGWEDSEAREFSKETDVNGLTWERFTSQQQLDEINSVWPEVFK
jgi:hypothetical protein